MFKDFFAPGLLTRTPPDCVAADVSRRMLARARMAPTDVGAYKMSGNRAECEAYGLREFPGTTFRV